MSHRTSNISNLIKQPFYYQIIIFLNILPLVNFLLQEPLTSLLYLHPAISTSLEAVCPISLVVVVAIMISDVVLIYEFQGKELEYLSL